MPVRGTYRGDQQSVLLRAATLPGRGPAARQPACRSRQALCTGAAGWPCRLAEAGNLQGVEGQQEAGWLAGVQ